MSGISELERALSEYRGEYPEEQGIADRFLELLREGHLAFTRDRKAGHLTASGWVVDAPRRRVLLVHHGKLDKWLQPGGHADGDTDLLRVARKEVLEETGLETEPLKGGEIFDLDIHPIPPRGELPGHYHFDVRFLLRASEGAEPEGNDETHEARWVPLDGLEEVTSEVSILRMRQKCRCCV
jgi:8-oxo-dGTP pyrophosphatase MutT (NUDIX family)